MEDVIKIMKSNIRKDTLLVEQAEMLKKTAGVSSSKALAFVSNLHRVLPENASGYAHGEFWHIYYKNRLLYKINKTRPYKGRGMRYEKYAKNGLILIELNSKTALQKFVDYIVKEENVYAYYMYEHWINRELSTYRRDKWRK